MRFLLPLAVTAGLLAAGCTPLRSHQGYIVDADLVNSIQPGVDNRQSVLATLGTPSFASQFNQGDWYYVSRDSRNLAFTPPPISLFTMPTVTQTMCVVELVISLVVVTLL